MVTVGWLVPYLKLFPAHTFLSFCVDSNQEKLQHGPNCSWCNFGCNLKYHRLQDKGFASETSAADVQHEMIPLDFNFPACPLLSVLGVLMVCCYSDCCFGLFFNVYFKVNLREQQLCSCIFLAFLWADTNKLFL